jgi:hypothetical protein
VAALIVVLFTPAAARLAVTPTVATLLSSGAVTAGTAVTDQATLSGVAQKASGTVTYKVFANGTCTGTPLFTSSVTVTNATVPASAPFTAVPAGTYQWQALYKQFANQAGVPSPCGSEPLIVTNAPAMTGQLSSTVALPGTVVTDTAALSGATSDAGGTVTYSVYSTPDCSDSAVFTSSVPVTNAAVPVSAGFTTGAGPLYEWQAVYSGDSKNQATSTGCGSEPLNVVPSMLAAQLSESVAIVGDQVTNQATLIGVGSDGGGSVTYNVYANGDCSGTPAFSSTVTVTAGTVPTSDPFTATAAGTYQWQVAYSGDGVYPPVTSHCGDEQLTVQNQPTVSTLLSESSGLKADAVTDQATLAGATADAGGTLTYRVYTSADCSGAQVFTSTVTVTNGQAPSSAVFIADPVGTYQWQATYSGDAKNQPAASVCGSEPLTISAAPLVSLLDMAPGQTYYGFSGGLYENGLNTMPGDHETDGLAAANAITPLATNGTPSASGKIVLLGIGASAQSLEWCGVSSNCLSSTNPSFMTFAAANPGVNHSSLVIVNGTQSAYDAGHWSNPGKPGYDVIRDHRLAPAGLKEAQVQIVWVEDADAFPTVSLPSPQADAYTLENRYGGIARALRTRYPNLKEVFFSSRVYGGYATTAQNPEPYAFESGLSVKWLVQAQINQMRTSVVDPVAGDLNQNGSAPWIAWGPYTWANGATANAQGTFYLRNDFAPDGTHPNFNGQTKVGNLLLNFFLNSEFTRCWFDVPAQTCP